MCGITGIYAFNKNGQTSFGRVNSAVQAMKLRGPDSQGIFQDGDVCLGHVRLSVIDVSDAAAQPYFDESQRYVIVFNGEIYNYKLLRKELQNEGHTFRSLSDTEVLLKLYILYGEKCLEKLQGFFAFAVYDKLTGELFIARDRIGIKPLLVYKDEDRLIFASEMKAVLAYDIKLTLDHNSLYTYLQLNYTAAPDSIFSEVKKLQAGTWLRIRDKNLDSGTYYTIPLPSENNTSSCISFEDAGNKLEELLEQAVVKRLVSDVPLGAFLSGGIDSSIIVALAARHTKQLNTFSIGFRDEPMFDETRYAQLVADKYKTNHTVFSLTTDDIFNEFQNVMDYIDEPFGDSSALAVYILSKQTRKHVTVALSGDGADELFGGYNKHSAELKARQLSGIAPLLKLTSPIWSIMPKSRNSKLLNYIRQVDRFAKGASLSASDRYWRWCAFADEKDAGKMLKAVINKDDYILRKNHVLAHYGGKSDLNMVLHTDMHLVLQNDMLVKVDLMSMANSLEVRVPFLDHDLVNFIFSLPSEYKISSAGRKIILREKFRDLLPEELLNRPKHGFEVPLLKWFRTELKNLIDKELLGESFIKEQGIFAYDQIAILKNSYFPTIRVNPLPEYMA
jgi:asparagine synthase (glutamine-hydrolysing)